ncbi:membrane protein [Formosa sp. Hel1_33_131]|uniref:LptF/LptG family permease n=1 Tax=Formosa sp. Hel1_33_131 TaxID=1336794 RepID=UPI0008651A25|nr:LptF/LptG family permease [Formosa sp. Hel1_33_131]AOR29600.1 membrane protein [Formosa sp. Hel1_33_131]
MKILDRYILTTYLKTFFSVFTILMMIFILQSVWVYISELAGKDLEIEIVLKFLLYVSPRIVVLVLPLTILLASIMVFGGFSENYEFAAMKSTGISLQRAMKSLSVFIIFLAVISFFFANSVIPFAEFNFYSLRRNIAKVKPAMAIAEGQFNQLNDINIKVAEKSGENGEFLKDVIIHQKKGTFTGNFTVIKANTGEFISDETSDILQLVLFDGNYYDEIQSKDYTTRTKNRPQVKSTFEKYIINIDVSQFNDIDFESKETITKHTMLNVVDLKTAIDSLNIKREGILTTFSETMLKRTNQHTLNLNYKLSELDSITETVDILNLYEERKSIQLIDLALNTTKTAKKDLTAKSKTMLDSLVTVNKHVVAFHDKFALGLSCIILFFVGAPLGALIRKGGIGLPLIIAILIFLTYHFIGLFAKNSSEDSSVDPVVAAWLSSLILLPFSIYLTNRATKDRALIDFDSVLIPLKHLVTSKSDGEIVDVQQLTSEDTSELDNFENHKLIDIVKNFRQFGLSLNYKQTALKILNTRGISELELKMGGDLSNQNYENALRLYIDFKENSKLALVLNILTIVLGFGGSFLSNNGIPVMGQILNGIAILSLIFFVVVFQKTTSNQSDFYKLLSIKFLTNSFVFIILGIPLFFLYRPFFVKKMKEDLLKIS